jgi:phosphopantothenoylcysteine decarboxylase/phosphopantothenate--cysteine ligase
MAAAVGDFRAAEPLTGKWKKADGPPPLELVPTRDVLAELGQAKAEGQCLIGFALEIGKDADVEASCRQKLQTKRLDLICGNHADRPEEGVGGERNRLYVLDRHGRGGWTAHATKQRLAREIWERAIELFAGGRDSGRANDQAEEGE